MVFWHVGIYDRSSNVTSTVGIVESASPSRLVVVTAYKFIKLIQASHTFPACLIAKFPVSGLLVYNS